MVLRRCLFGVLLSCGLMTSLSAYETINPSDLHHHKGAVSRSNPRQMADQVQADLLDRLFLSKMMEFNEGMSLLSEEERAQFGHTQQYARLQQDMFRKLLAKQMAERDVLKIRRQLLRGGGVTR